MRPKCSRLDISGNQYIGTDARDIPNVRVASLQGCNTLCLCRLMFLCLLISGLHGEQEWSFPREHPATYFSLSSVLQYITSGPARMSYIFVPHHTDLVHWCRCGPCKLIAPLLGQLEKVIILQSPPCITAPSVSRRQATMYCHLQSANGAR